MNENNFSEDLDLTNETGEWIVKRPLERNLNKNIIDNLDEIKKAYALLDKLLEDAYTKNT